MECAEGWEPLCRFLEVDVPETPFPRLNDSKMFIDRIIDGALVVLKEWRDAVAPWRSRRQPADHRIAPRLVDNLICPSYLPT